MQKKIPAQFTYNTGVMPLKCVQVHKYVGILLKSNLKWNTYIKNVFNKAQKKLWTLRGKLEFAGPELNLTAYISY